MSKVSLTVNGNALSAEVEPRTHLADLLRETHNLTGTHIGCEHGVCGACTLLVDGAPIRSCITFAVACENANVITIEGLDEDEIARELRAAFTAHHALQCGYCTPGMIVSARDAVLRMEAPSEHDIRVEMSGNLCRCTGYVGIVRAIQSVIADRRARGVAAVPGGNRDRLGPAGSGCAHEAHMAPLTVVSAVVRAAPRLPVGAAASLETDWKPQVEFRQSFVIAHPVEEVWAFFGRVEDVAACLPGASLGGGEKDGRVDGKIRVKAGPISAEFSGVAHITRNNETHRGTIVGAGRDARSNSATRGMITYSIKPDEGGGAGSRIDVDVGYTLTGMLAQFSRTSLVQDLASRLTVAFAQNLEVRLSAGNAGPAPPAVRELNAGSLIAEVLFGKVRRFFGRFFGRS